MGKNAIIIALSIVAIILAATSLYFSLQNQKFKADTLYALGDLYMQDRRPFAAAAAYEQATALDKRPYSYRALGSAYLAARNYTAAEIILRKALDENSTDWDSLYLLANVHLSDSKFVLAEQELKKVIEKLPDSDNAYDALGTLYLDQENLNLAEQMFKKGINISQSNDANLHNGLGVTYLKMKKIDLAINEFRIALSIDPNHANARRNLEVATAAASGQLEK